MLILTTCNLENSYAFQTVTKGELLSLGWFLKIIDIGTLELRSNLQYHGGAAYLNGCIKYLRHYLEH